MMKLRRFWHLQLVFCCYWIWLWFGESAFNVCHLLVSVRIFEIRTHSGASKIWTVWKGEFKLGLMCLTSAIYFTCDWDHFSTNFSLQWILLCELKHRKLYWNLREKKIIKKMARKKRIFSMEKPIKFQFIWNIRFGIHLIWLNKLYPCNTRKCWPTYHTQNDRYFEGEMCRNNTVENLLCAINPSRYEHVQFIFIFMQTFFSHSHAI